jgi:transcriptional regulator with XRE-family HTH domain
VSHLDLFAVELRRALERRNVTQRSLAETVGVSCRQVWYWTSARSLPYVATATRIADALEAGQLVEIVRAARTAVCRNCGRKIVSETSNMSRRYCDEACRRLAVKKGRQGRVPDARDRKIALLTAAVDRMCRACEPAGVCADGACPLRLVSPFPLRAGLVLVAPAPDGRRSRWDDPRERERASETMRAIHAATRDRSERVTAWNRARWAGMTAEERAERGRKISAGIRRGRRESAA